MKLRYYWLGLVFLALSMLFGSAADAVAVIKPFQPTIAAGKGSLSGHSLAIKKDGTLWAWGYNEYGQLGLGSVDKNPHPTPVQVGSGYAAVTAGYEYYGYSLGVKADGTLWAWGRNRYGQLGLGSADLHAHPTPVQVGSATNWLAVAGGGGYTLALQDDGSLWAWGSNSWGELGLGSSDVNPHPTPVRVGSATGWVAVASGGNHSLGVKADGSLWAWGDNLYGDLGLGDTTERDSPALVWPRSNPGLNLLLLGD
jgi:alpha-tubulin suppressor-like RCC1 family protein